VGSREIKNINQRELKLFYLINPKKMNEEANNKFVHVYSSFAL
jgi:hypothetical protein